LRPAIYAAGEGEVRFRRLRYDALQAPPRATELRLGAAPGCRPMSLTRRELLGGGLAAASLCAAGVRASAAVSRPANVRWLIWYRRPASYWVEALPVGNGRLGAMVFGGTDHERLQLNEDTWWAGGPYDPSHPDARAALPEVRALLR